MGSKFAKLLANTAWTPFSLYSTGRAAGRWGLPSAHGLGLGDPVKLDERCSLEAHSPEKLTRPICGTYGKHFAYAWLRVFPAPKQSPRRPTIRERKPLTCSWHNENVI